jgi:hypothetical protein
VPPPTDIGLALAHALDPVLFCRDRLDFTPDDWQCGFLRSERRQIIMNCGRQIGKSTVVAAKAVHTALYRPGSLCLVIAPTQRQSRELALKIGRFLDQMEPTPALDEANKLSMTLANSSRIVALPGDGATIRGYSAPDLVLVDEGAFVAPDTFVALVPMQASNPDGQLVLLSTPNGTAGFFYDAWFGDGDWERYEIPTSSCPRMSAQWLDERRRDDPLNFPREYECQWGSAEDSLFPDELLNSLETSDFAMFDIGLAA